ncbi:Bug family tripartite tricarboxylate transporter substrate binding protein [Rhodoligotrophos defluvii]|uniref:Bug family tripartite tricarboxylate transporter substrate binding protein n=1 Tax=Rhodoligotrophos defluvii TaxID=2561934 RepID=UPI00148574AF|nr:tripartite tricarboxylate transporter substrate binding protein [Rhodoligotrophos defluvii]
MKLAYALCSALLLAVGISAASAENYPTKPIRMIVPFAAGGSTDTTARIIAEGMTEILGQPVVVENKPGGLGIVAIEEMARSKPDGYTVMMGSGMVNGATVAIHPGKFSIDYDKDVTVVSRVADVPAVYVATSKNFPPSNIEEFRKYAKENPGKVRYCSTGVGSALHIEMSIFMKKEGLDLVHVPYADGNTAPDLINGDLHFCSLNIIQARPLIKAGHMKPIVVTTNERLPDFPDTPTMKELGYPELSANYWGALYVPAATPPEVIDKLFNATVQAQAIPKVREKFLSNQMIPVVSKSLEEAKAWNASELERWRKNLAESGVQVSE